MEILPIVSLKAKKKITSVALDENLIVELKKRRLNVSKLCNDFIQEIIIEIPASDPVIKNAVEKYRKRVN